MRKILLLIVVASALFATSHVRSIRAAHPEAEIANDVVSAKLYLPDPKDGYYRGARFDWSGVIYSLKFAGTSTSVNGKIRTTPI